MSNFHRAQSKVWYSDEPTNRHQTKYESVYSSIDREFLYKKINNQMGIDKINNCNTSVISGTSRQGSPSSHKSQVKYLRVILKI